METQGENFVPNIPSQQPVLEPKKSNAKLIIAVTTIIVIVAITAGVFGWMFAKKSQAPAARPAAQQPAAPAVQTQPSADETAGWQTYTNAKYGFEFRYPRDWNNIISSNNPNSGFLEEVDVTNNRLLNAFDLDTPNRKADKNEVIYSVDILKHSDDIPFQDNVHYEKIFSNSNYDIFLVDDFRNSNRPEFNKILSTFKLTKSAADETADWQTYTDLQNGFSIKYPTDWKTMPLANDFQGISLSKDGNTAIFAVVYYKSLSDMSTDPGIELKSFVDLKNDTLYTNAQETFFLGYRAIVATFTNPAINLTESKIFVSKDGAVYEISYDINKDKSISEQILSTFKFTN